MEFFSLRKLIGVIASLAGVVLISRADISGENDKSRGSFPHKTSEQIAIGDVLALLSAIIYGIYTTMMKKNIRDETRVNMIWFFGFVGLFNITLLLPGFPIFHYTGLETFEFPPTKRVLTIVLVCYSLFSHLGSKLFLTTFDRSIQLSLCFQTFVGHTR